MPIAPCRCAHRYQDEKYGAGNRVHNPLAKTPGALRCTVCGSVKDRKKGEAPKA